MSKTLKFPPFPFPFPWGGFLRTLPFEASITSLYLQELRPSIRFQPLIQNFHIPHTCPPENPLALALRREVKALPGSAPSSFPISIPKSLPIHPAMSFKSHLPPSPSLSSRSMRSHYHLRKKHRIASQRKTLPSTYLPLRPALILSPSHITNTRRTLVLSFI